MGNIRRYWGLDWARAIAIMLIMLCHWSRSIKADMVGDWCGIIGNSIFFLLSALLMGLAWKSQKCPRYGVNFLVRRMKRIFPAYWVTILVISGIFALEQKPVQLIPFLLNAAGLSWFFKINGAGYLWFVTAIMLIYVEIVCLSRIERGSRRIMCSMALVLLLAQFVISRYSHVHQIWFLTFVIVCGAVFLEADRLVRFMQKHSAVLGVVGLIIAICLCMAITSGVLRNGTPATYWFGSTIAFSFIGFCLSDRVQCESKVVAVISDISYELYLVHAIFCYLIPLKAMTGNVTLYLLSFALCSVISALVLKKLVSLMQTRLVEERK
jgi:peptidoglycan/LPS O-acetylase OafA/YrhL